MFNVRVIDLLVLAVYFAVMFGIGLAASRKIKSVADFYMGGRRFGRAMMAMYAFGSGTHADTAVGVVAQTYKLGMAGIWYQWLQIFNTPFYWLLAGVFRRARCMTTAELYELRYGPSIALLYTGMGIFINISFLGLMLLGSGRLIEALTGGAIHFTWAVCAMTVSFLLYAVMGGLIATVWNDFLQGILTIVMSFLILPFLLASLGGVHGVRERLADPAGMFSLIAPGEIGLYWIVAASINQMFAIVAQPQLMSNTAAGETELDNRIGFCVGVTLKRVCTIAWALTGVFALAYYGSGNMSGDHVFGSLVRDVLPQGFAGLMIACIMASVMDNGAVLVVTTSALFTRNLIKFPQDGADSGRQEVRIARLFGVVFVTAGLWLAYAFPDVPSFIRFMFNIVPLVGIAFWLGLWWRRANRYGAWASFLASSAVWAYGYYGLAWRGDARLPHLITAYLSAGLVAGIVVSWLTPPESELQLNRFFLTIHTPIDQNAMLPQRLEALEIKPLDRSGFRGDGRRVLVSWANWEIPVPGRQAAVGFLVVLAASLFLHAIVIGACKWFGQY